MKRHFAPPPPPEPPAPKPQLYERPDDQILLHGEMIRDTATIEAKLQGLPFAGSEYRGNLRVIISAALRIRDACQALLGELAAEVEEATDRLAERIADRALETPEEEARRIWESMADSPNLVPPTRKHGRAPKAPKVPKAPKETAADAQPPGGRKAEILAALRKRAMTSGELIAHFKDKASPQAIYVALSVMRNENLIDTRRDPLDGESKNFIK